MAKKQSGGGKRRSARDKQRAAFLKRIGDDRRVGVCPICGRYTRIGSAMANHIRLHAGE